MANIGTIAVTLTADSRPFTRGIGVARGSAEDFGKAFARLDAQTRRIGGSSGITQSLNGTAAASGNAARGVLELSRGVEDAAVSFGLNGIQGAIRGSMNNLSQFATMMGGPVTGAIAGFTAAGVAIAAPWIASLFEVKTALADVEKLAGDAAKNMETLADRNVKRRSELVDFAQEVRGLSSVEDANKAGNQRADEIESINAQREQIESQKEQLRQFLEIAEKGDLDALRRKLELTEAEKQYLAQVEGAEKALHGLALDDIKLLKEKLELERQMEALLIKRGELRKQQAQKEADDLANDGARLIREMQEADEREQEAKQKKAEEDARRKDLSDNERLQSLLKGRISGLGGKNDPLEGMNIPEGMRPQLEGLFSRLDEMDQRRGPQFASVATAGSQSMLRAQFQAKEAAEAKQQRAKLLERVNALITEVKGLRNDGRNAQDGDDVNLN